MINLTGVEMAKVLDETLRLVPLVLPTIIGFISVRKGISFLTSALRGA